MSEPIGNPYRRAFWICIGLGVVLLALGRAGEMVREIRSAWLG